MHTLSSYRKTIRRNGSETTRPASASFWTVVLLTVTLLAVFYGGVWLLPRIARAVAARSLYNYRDQVRQALDREDYDGAVAVLRRAAREIPRDIYFERPEFIEDRIGQIRLQQGRTTESLQAFLSAQKGFFRNIELRGYFPPPRLVLDIIRGCFATGDPAGAHQEARIGMDFYPMMNAQLVQPHVDHSAADPRILRDLALLAATTGNYSLARDRLRKSLADDARTAESHYWLGRLDEMQNLPGPAAKAYEAELAAFPYADNAYSRLLAIYQETGRDVQPLLDRRETMRAKALAEFLPADPSKPLAGLLTVGSACEQTFELEQPARLLVNILAGSTPCHGLFGWVEITFDGRHVQNLYVCDPLSKRNLLAHHVWLGRVEAGRHLLRIENLSDALDERDDRNVFIHNIRIFCLEDNEQ